MIRQFITAALASRFKACILFLLLALAPFDLSAHPHLFINTYYTLVFDAEGLVGIRVFWCMDEMYSAMTVADFDSNGDGTLNDKEAKELARLANESLPDFNFFTNIEIEGRPYPVKTVSDLLVTFESGYLNYEFFVPCKVEDNGKKQTMKISPYDPEYFAAMFFTDDQPVLLENAEEYTITISIGEDPEKKIYFDMVHPMTLKLTFQRKS